MRPDLASALPSSKKKTLFCGYHGNGSATAEAAFLVNAFGLSTSPNNYTGAESSLHGRARRGVHHPHTRTAAEMNRESALLPLAQVECIVGWQAAPPTPSHLAPTSLKGRSKKASWGGWSGLGRWGSYLGLCEKKETLWKGEDGTSVRPRDAAAQESFILGGT